MLAAQHCAMASPHPNDYVRPTGPLSSTSSAARRALLWGCQLACPFACGCCGERRYLLVALPSAPIIPSCMACPGCHVFHYTPGVILVAALVNIFPETASCAPAAGMCWSRGCLQQQCCSSRCSWLPNPAEGVALLRPRVPVSLVAQALLLHAWVAWGERRTRMRQWRLTLSHHGIAAWQLWRVLAPLWQPPQPGTLFRHIACCCSADSSCARCLPPAGADWLPAAPPLLVGLGPHTALHMRN